MSWSRRRSRSRRISPWCRDVSGWLGCRWCASSTWWRCPYTTRRWTLRRLRPVPGRSCSCTGCGSCSSRRNCPTGSWSGIKIFNRCHYDVISCLCVCVRASGCVRVCVCGWERKRWKCKWGSGKHTQQFEMNRFLNFKFLPPTTNGEIFNPRGNHKNGSVLKKLRSWFSFNRDEPTISVIIKLDETS